MPKSTNPGDAETGERRKTTAIGNYDIPYRQESARAQALRRQCQRPPGSEPVNSIPQQPGSVPASSIPDSQRPVPPSAGREAMIVD